MKGFKIALIAVLSVIAIALCGLLAWGIGDPEGWERFATDKASADKRLVLDEEVSLDGIDSIDISYDMNSNDVYFYEAEGDALRVKEYVYYEAREDEISTVNVKGSTLEISGKRRRIRYRGIFSFGYSSSYTEIWLPSSYKNALKVKTSSGEIRSDITIALDAGFSGSSSSGDIALKEVSATDVALAASSGSINGTAICAADGTGSITISTSSGDITVEQADGNMKASASSGYIKIKGGSGTREIYTSSGDVLIEGLQDDFDIHTTSGEAVVKGDKGTGSISTSSGDVRLTLSELAGSLAIHTTSGDVRLTLSELTGSLAIYTTSGEVRLGLPADAAVDFGANTSSGDIRTFFDDSLSFSKRGNSAKGTIGSEPRQEVRIETSSGDVRVTEL